MKLFLIGILLLACWLGGIYLLHRQSKKSRRRRRRSKWLKRRSLKVGPEPENRSLDIAPDPEKAPQSEEDPCDWEGSPDKGYPDRETVDFDCPSFVDVVSSGPFLFQPMIQLGHPRPDDEGARLEIVWGALSDDGDWSVAIECGDPCATARASRIEKQPVELRGLTRHTLMRVRVDRINPGQRLEYRIFKDGVQVFAATTTAPFGRETMAHRFAVVGDMGTGRSGNRSVAHQIWKHRPDLMVFVGDITYRFGRAGEYMLRFFPIYNADRAEPESGAPILRSIPSFTSAGNHCMGKSAPDQVPSFDQYADLYAYYLYWSMPLNGPEKIAGQSSTADLLGSPERINAFEEIAGDRFPVMANYSFDYGNAHWLVLDANAYMDWTEESLREWVEEDLKNVDPGMWKFVNFHQPPFTSNLKHKREKRMRLLCDLFEKYGVNIVFNGHAHTYERTYPLKFSLELHEDGSKIDETGHVGGSIDKDLRFDGLSNTTPQGIIYIVTGAGGAPHDSEYLHRRPHLWEPFTYKLIGDRFSFTVCDIDGDQLTLRQVDADGLEIDRIVITR